MVISLFEPSAVQFDHVSRMQSLDFPERCRVPPHNLFRRSKRVQSPAEVLPERSSVGFCKKEVLRAEWTERIKALTQSLDLEAEFTAEGCPHVETDQNGKVLHKSAGFDNE